MAGTYMHCLCNLRTILWDRYCHPHFTEMGTEAWRGYQLRVTQLVGGGVGLEPRLALSWGWELGVEEGSGNVFWPFFSGRIRLLFCWSGWRCWSVTNRIQWGRMLFLLLSGWAWGKWSPQAGSLWKTLAEAPQGTL